VVITGGSSGIGRETALRLARSGAQIVVISRDEEGLTRTVQDIVRGGGRARHIVCDVTDLSGLHAAVGLVQEWFGRIDTWVGNAGVLVYSRFDETSPDDFRRLLEVNFIGQINGLLAALPALRRTGGGALVCVSSAEAVVTLPMHSAYASSKRALEGALDGLRRELMDGREPISVTAVRPAVIDTAIFRHARNRMGLRPKGPRPYYDPAVVAEAIAFAAEHPRRVIHAGGGGRVLTSLQMLLPGAVDAVLARFGAGFMHTDEPVPMNEGNLDRSLGAAARWLPRRGRRWSVYTWFATHPRIRRATALAALVLCTRMVSRVRR
jgi:NAD(P)-dependent dehydrogenase (short-subunit alcohol dehydrogenase family)